MRRKYLVGVGVLVLAAGYLLYMGFSSSVTYYATVGEFLDKGPEMYDKNVRVTGEIADNSIEWDAEELELSFAIAEGSSTLPVVYKGAMPDRFKEGAPVMVEGKYRSDNIFRASRILMRCPSKYVPEE